MAKTLLPTERRGMFPMLRREPFQALREEMEDLLERFWGEGDGWLTGAMTPSLDLVETETEIEARMDLPGVKPDEIDVRLSGNVLTVSGERKEEKETRGYRLHRVERRSGAFSRSITLPCHVMEEKVDAEYHDGVLRIKLPKVAEEVSHKVEVKS